MTSITTWAELHRLTDRAARAFGITDQILIEPITHPKARIFGRTLVAPDAPARIQLRLHRLGRRAPLARSTLLDTLAHELAHLLIWEHGAAHQQLTKEIRQWIAAQ